MNFLAPDFFDLEKFDHKDLFNSNHSVWEALKKLDLYIDKKLAEAQKETIVIDPTSTIQDTARIEGKAVIGKNCIIGHGVLLRNGVVIGDNVFIGHGGEIKHSIILNDTSIGHLNYVGDSVIGNNVNISGGAIIANLRLDRAPVKVKNEEILIDTGLEKFGAVVGDGVTVGVNAVLNPGTLLGKNSLVYPLVSVKGCHPEASIIKER